MTKLRKASIQQILNTLDNTIFTSHAFEAKFNVSDSEIVRIAFKEDKHSSFAIKRDGGTWLTYEAPGPILVDQEITRLGDLHHALTGLSPGPIEYLKSTSRHLLLMHSRRCGRESIVSLTLCLSQKNLSMLMKLESLALSWRI
jgi:hypothetical protein